MITVTNIIVLIVLFLILFGAKKIPSIMHDLGRSLKTFKDGFEGKDIQDLQTSTKRIKSSKYIKNKNTNRSRKITDSKNESIKANSTIGVKQNLNKDNKKSK